MAASSSGLPMKSLRANSSATAMPNGSATAVATLAMRSDSRIAVQSWAVRSNTRYDAFGGTRKLKP